jgi:hypothetical protein
VSGETAAIGLGFLLAGPVGAIVAGAALPVLAAATMWRSRRREHDENTNSQANGTGSDGTKSGRDRSGAGSGGGRGNGGGGRHRSPNSSGGGKHKTPKGPGSGKSSGSGAGLGGGSGKNRKPKVKDPVADKLAKTGKGLADKFKNRDKNSSGDKTAKHDKRGKDTAGTGTNDAKESKSPKTPKSRKDHRGNYPDNRPWRGRGHKDKAAKEEKPSKTKTDQKGDKGDDTTSTTARDGLAPINPDSGNGGSQEEIFDAEIVDDGLPPKPDQAPDDVIDGGVIDEDRIALVRARREKAARRAAIRVGKKAAADAARDGNLGDPRTVQAERIRTENQWIDLELHREAQLLALAAETEQRRSTPVNYPVATTTPGSHTPGVAVARQIDARGTIAYRLLLTMAEQLAGGHGDADADMADHVTELAGIPTMCRNLALAVREAANALSKTAPLHPSVIKHLNSAAVSAITAARMADTIITVFVAAHREDIYRVMNPRTGEDRWNIRNAAGTLDAAKLRSAILSAGQPRLALPTGNTTSGKLAPASDAGTKQLVTLMKGFDRGHMVDCLSEVAGAANGVEIVADSITKLYRRMINTWPTEDTVDDTVLATASKVKNIAAELRKAIKAAQRAHERELKLNAKPRKGARSEAKWDVATGRRG